MEKQKIDRFIDAFRNAMYHEFKVEEEGMVANAPGTQGGFGGGVGNKTNKRGSGFSSRKSKKSGNKGSSSSSKGSKSRKTAGSKNKRGSGMRGRRGRRGGRRGGARDPLAQSFFISEQNGIFLTSAEVFFERVDDNGIPVSAVSYTHLTLPTICSV